MVVTKPYRALIALMIVLAVAPTAFAERLTGSIRGRITDKAGFPLPGAFIYVASDSLLGRRNYITADSGDYGFLHLNPGTYRVTVEMPGFKTVNVENIQVDTGKALTLNVKLESTEIEEEVTSQQAPPLIDSRSAVTSLTIDSDLLRHAPLGRDFAAVVRLAPGVIQDDLSPDRFFSVHGSTVRADTYVVGGANLTDPLTMAAPAGINVDTIDQVEFETAGRPAETFTSEGGFINIITKSGSNAFLGEFKAYHTSSALTKQLWSEADRAGKGAVAAPMPQRYWDFSLNMGGPIMEDRAWYFSSFRLGLRSKDTPFTLWTDPLGTAHDPYRWRDAEFMGFLKLTTQIGSDISASATVGYSNRYEPVAESYLNVFTPKSATRSLQNDGLFHATGVVTYRLNQDTFVDVVAGLVQRSTPYRLNADAQALPSYVDAASGYSWGSAEYNQASTGRRFHAGGVVTRLQNGLGIGHELRAGINYEETYDELSTWKENNLIMNYLDGSPYYFGTAASPKTGNPVGKGLIGFYLASQAEGGLLLKNTMKRVGLFAQDSLTIAHRATFNLGLRFDHSVGAIQAMSKGASGNAISITLGDTLIKTISGFNPYAAGSVPSWDSALVWNALSPRAGLSLDLLGNGRTFLKSSFARYSEGLNLSYPLNLSLVKPTDSHKFFWFDENANSAVDATDSFGLYPEDYRMYQTTVASKRIAPDTRAPYTDELTFGLQQEVFRNLSISLTYISKTQKNILENVLFDPDAGVEWYTADSGAGNYWVPFTTVVPAALGYPETTMTVYFRSNTAPAVFERLQNVSQLERRYGAIEFTVRKRMSDNWQFYGSIVWGRAKGNIGLNSAWSTGFSPAAGSPNYFINIPADSRLDLDRPASVRLLGTYRFPRDFYLTLYYTGRSGYPWARSVTIVPPDTWTQANGAVGTPVTVYLEKPGTRRTRFDGNLDMRLEKEFLFKNRKRLALTIDVFNFLGHKSSLLDLNDGGYWYPATADSAQGQRVLSPTFEKYISLLGERKFQFSLSVQF
jgi:hypothetical protein